MSGKTFAKVFSKRGKREPLVLDLPSRKRLPPEPEPEARLGARIPQAVHDHLMFEAHRRRLSMRAILLEALAAIGIDGSERGR